MPLAAAIDATTELAREIAVMKKLNHPNVVKLFEVCVQVSAITMWSLELQRFRQGPEVCQRPTSHCHADFDG
jgi:serine/threonine protein kinase